MQKKKIGVHLYKSVENKQTTQKKKKIVGYLYKSVNNALLVKEAFWRGQIVRGNVAASVFVLRPEIVFVSSALQ